MQMYLVKLISLLMLFSCGTGENSTQATKDLNLNISPVLTPETPSRNPALQPGDNDLPIDGQRPGNPISQRPEEPVRDPYLKTYRCMYQRGDQVNRCVQFSFIEMSKEAELGLLCQNLSFPGSYFVTMEASPCPDRNWFFSSRRQFQAYSADIWMINVDARPGPDRPVVGRPRPRPDRPVVGRPVVGRPRPYRPRGGGVHDGRRAGKGHKNYLPGFGA